MKMFFAPAFLLLSFFAAAQSYVVRDIKSFGARGDGKTNDHEAFQKAAAFFNARGGNGKLVISKGTYVVGKQVFNRNTKLKPVYEGSDALSFVAVRNLVVEGEMGASLKYADGLRFGAFQAQNGTPYFHGNNFFADGYSLGIVGNAISLQNCSNVVIRTIDLDGNNENLILGGVYGDTGIQIPHNGIFIINASNVKVENVKAHHFGLDGIMIGSNTGDSANPDHILLSNSTFEFNGRQGLSWIGGNDLKALNCRFNHNGRGKISSMPKSGVDIEAEMGLIKNGLFNQCEFINNAGCGLVADSGPSSNCTFNGCTFWGVTNWSLWITKPGFKITNSKIYGSFVHGYDAATDAEATEFQHCLFEDRPYKGQEPFGNFLIETNQKRRVRFDDCTMLAHKKKIVWMESNPSWKPEEKYQLKNCRLIYESDKFPEGGWVSLTRNIRFKNCTFEMLHPAAEKQNFYFNGVTEKYNVNLGGNRIIINKKETRL
jgi:hypothetical protein